MKRILQKLWKILGKTTSPGLKTIDTETSPGNMTTKKNTESTSSQETRVTITKVKVNKIDLK